MDIGQLQEMALQAGFSKAVPLDVKTMKVCAEVREMCASGRCQKYGTNWACPPACGTLEECDSRIHAYKRGILVQTIGDLEDEYDGESMMETQNRHKKQFAEFLWAVRTAYPNTLALGAGCCTICSTCSYPTETCRFPEKAFSSLESYGIMVMDLCKANELDYYYGPLHIAYTSCYLLE